MDAVEKEIEKKIKKTDNKKEVPVDDEPELQEEEYIQPSDVQPQLNQTLCLRQSNHQKFLRVLIHLQKQLSKRRKLYLRTLDPTMNQMNI
jgi:hypothetical protein